MAVEVKMMVNDEEVVEEVEPRLLLVHFVRDTLGLTGTHVGCDTSTAVRAPFTWTATPSDRAPCSRSRPTAPR
jgi:hypothetical protein